MKEKLKQKKGITLIALVITIIVLLILAGVSIATLTGENGILTQANDAKNETKSKGLKEEIQLAVQSKNIADQAYGNGNLEEELNKIEGATVTTVEDGTYCVERDGYSYTVYDNGEIEEGKLDKWDGTTIEAPIADEQGNWHIYTAAQMKFFANYCNNVLTETEKTEANMPEITNDTVVYLENNIDMGARQEEGVLTTAPETQWKLIKKLKGTFDGKEHYISGIYVSEMSHAGVFGIVNEIKNTTIKDSYIFVNSTAYGGLQMAGGLAYTAGGDIINCHNVNTTVKCIEGGQLVRVGGLIALPDDNIEIRNSTNSGKIIGDSFVGGIIGGADIVGFMYEVNLINCSNTGEIVGQKKIIGGIAGATYGKVEKCYNKGNIIGKTYIGGIVGNTSSDVKETYNSGIIEGESLAGGIIGTVSGKNTIDIKNCYNKGQVKGTSDIGTIIGKNAATGTVSLSNLYYLSSLGLGAIGGKDNEELKIKAVDKDINSYEEFLKSELYESE